MSHLQEVLPTQFGAEYRLLREFKKKFLCRLPDVVYVYPAVRLSKNSAGLYPKAFANTPPACPSESQLESHTLALDNLAPPPDHLTYLGETEVALGRSTPISREEADAGGEHPPRRELD